MASPENVARIYARMESSLAVVRRRLGRALTLADKIVLGHLDDAETQPLVPGESVLRLRPDRVAFQDVLGQTGLLQFMQTRRDHVAVPTSIHCDHLIQARDTAASDLAASLGENREIYDFLRTAAARYGCDFWPPGAGIIHQVILENYAFPGAMIVGTDSHTPNAGGLSACAVGVGGAEAVETIAGLPWDLLYPRRVAVYLSGAMRGWTAPKDVILYVAGTLTVSGATNAIIEYIGPGARTISATGKATIANMGAELGATTSIFPTDEMTLRYLQATRRGDLVPLVRRNLALLTPDPAVEAEPEAFYDRVIRLDLSTLEPYIVGPHSPDRARPISRFAAEIADPANGFVDSIGQALIGSCTNSSYEDMSRAADIAAQVKWHGARMGAPLMVTPGSDQVRATIERDGQMQALRDADAVVLANACGPCIGQWRRATANPTAPNTIVTSYNRNFPRRNDGQPTTMNFIASPEIVTALAAAGRLSFNPLTDTLIGGDGRPFCLEPPRPAPDVPPAAFVPGTITCVRPPKDGRGIELAIDPASERLHRMDPWPAWDGRDFLDMPVLVKAKGKTTTDAISPAGPWLRYRGHLDRFSDNMFMGAINAFTGEAGTGRNLLTGETNQPFAATARAYRAAGVQWVVIGDANYGEGSSREHAALSPRLLGGVAVIARSFARIHETNLKKQGLLALTFIDPADYDRLREDDRISLVDIALLEPGQGLRCDIRHADGTVESVFLRHSYTVEQLAWFRSGSALNAVAAQ